ncbi:MAG: hypothetical protein K940chlam5_01004 [Candidatus Anoxychlamydiales bacterium]|uniref:Uncharacterized protein n=1 Tax=marine sediment metagenome TaxID=412755 RepID=A0A0F9I470_9ZZZZ|nr:hypothetical protein [Candidatus Anoxychlamydiales bacterium]
MSSEVKKRKYLEPKDPIKEKFDVRNVIIPFSLMSGKIEEYNYIGEEKIPFSKRHPICREFLKHYSQNIAL